MRATSARASFDVSDVHRAALTSPPRDKTVDILDIAVRKLSELGGESVDDVARMSRWTLRNAGVVVAETTCGAVSRFDVGPLSVWRVQSVVGIGPLRDKNPKPLTHEHATELVTALLRALDKANT